MKPLEYLPVGVERNAGLLKTIFHKVGVGLCLVDADERVLAANADWLASTGFSADQVVGRDIIELFPASRDLARERHAAARERGHVDVPRHSQVLQGRETWWEGDVFGVDLPEGRGLVIVARNITDAVERERAEEHRADAENARLRVEEGAALLDAIFEHAPVGIGYWDRELRFRRVNQALADMNGLPVEDHLGKQPSEVLPDIEGILDIEASWRELLQEDRALVETEVFGETPKAPGRKRSWSESWYPVKVGHEVTGIAGFVRETTEARQSRELYDLLLGVVGHDLRDPLSVISTGVALRRQQGALDPRTAKVLDLIERGAERMKGIIDLLLDYTLAETGQLALERAPTDLDAICRSLLDAAAAMVRAPGRIEYHPGDAGGGLWDERRVRQAVQNLVNNALEHGSPATPVVVSWEGDERDVVLEVANQGPPIPPELLGHIFEPLQRGAGAKRPSKGLGLGLYITRQLVLAHGGELDVRSNAEATVFRMTLPRGS